MKRFLLFFILQVCLSAYAQHKQAYQIFTSTGDKTDYFEMLNQVKSSNITLFGEQHNSAIAHWLQFELTKDLVRLNIPVILGAEMFERDNQEALNQYLLGEINQAGLDTLARLWSNYKTDYAPLVNLAKKHQLGFVATNIPRRYASMVFRNGFDVLLELPDDEKEYMAPLPIAFDPELPTYQNILTMMGDHGSPLLVKAQAIKDATMAFSILENFEQDTLFLHFNGAYHSDYYEGIVWYLMKEKPQLAYVVISTVTQPQLEYLSSEHYNKADFIIVVNENVTTTY